jgi:hypothetical protein
VLYILYNKYLLSIRRNCITCIMLGRYCVFYFCLVKPAFRCDFSGGRSLGFSKLVDLTPLCCNILSLYPIWPVHYKSFYNENIQTKTCKNFALSKKLALILLSLLSLLWAPLRVLKRYGMIGFNRPTRPWYWRRREKQRFHSSGGEDTA